MSTYRSFRKNSSGSDMLSFSATSSELIQKNNISRSTLDRIFRYVKQQGDSFFLKVKHKYTKSDDIDSNRYDKSIFVISINLLVFPIASTNLNKLKRLHEEEVESDDIKDENCRNGKICHDEFQEVNPPIFPDTYGGFKTAWSKKQPSVVKKTALNNKEELIKNKYSRNIDYIDANSEDLEIASSSCPSSISTSEESCKEEFFEDKLRLSSSKSYNNSSFSNNSSSRNSRNISKKPAEWQELRRFYPLSEKDITTLNFRANREFSTNFVNQLLLKLYIKYPEKRFKNKFTFLSYMEQILKNEKHQGPLVNHTSFRFSCNIGTTEKNLLEYEKYLSQIENSFDTSKKMQVRKKIAGRFSTNMAYEILTQVEFKTNHDNSFITALIPNRLDLSERQQVILSEQLAAVYGINGYYVTVLEEDVNKVNVGYSARSRWKDERKEEIENPYSKIKESDIISNSKDIGILDSSKELDITEENTAWHKIRKGLIEELGENIDKAWFSKAEANECNDTKTLTLTMPTRFMADWVKNNYSHVVRRFADSTGIKCVEYGYV